jgi:hypothetical protein
LALPKQRPYGILGSAAAVARAFGQADRNVDRDDRRCLWRDKDVGEVGINGDEEIVACRSDESRYPAARTTIDASHP